MLIRSYLFGGVLLILTVLSGVSFANDYYSAGFKAYIKGDYANARLQWLQSAKSGDAKSMFNLGLLHEQDRVDNANQEKATEWYRLAGKAGYPPANYHLALILFKDTDNTQASKDKALVFMNKAADKGFIPAIDYLNNNKATGRSNTQTSKINPIKDSIKQVPKDRLPENHKGYLSESWVMKKRPSYWTIQMLAFNDERNVQAFIDQHKLKTKAAYFKERVAGETFYKLVYGVYKTKVQADFARQNLAKELTKHGPWLRPIESVQSVIKAQ